MQNLVLSNTQILQKQRHTQSIATDEHTNPTAAGTYARPSYNEHTDNTATTTYAGPSNNEHTNMITAAGTHAKPSND
jgi:hypothetical protein